MNALMLLLVWTLPLLFTVFAGQRCAKWLVLIAPLPALLAAAVLPAGTSISLPWLLLGVELGLDDTARLFLGFSGLLWLAASLYAADSEAGDHDSARSRVFFLLAMSGNLGLIVAQDMVSFYLGFAAMGLAVYGLIVHRGSQRARQAARRYLAWTIAGELLLFVAVVTLVAQNSGVLSFSGLRVNPPDGWVVLLLIIGFGIKLALPGLHVWLPQTYAVTPTPAVAVLSGAMIKAGLLGWLRFLAPGDAQLAGWGQALMVAGAIGIFFGALVGLQQRRPRLLLAYSSISKMGVLTTGMGAALAWPAAAPAVVVALGVYAAHHALVKGALFLGLGLVERGGLRPWLLAGLGFLALALAGAPLTSGAVAKSVLMASLPLQVHYLVSVLAASAFATALLMARFLFLVWRRRTLITAPHAAASTTAWLILLAVIAMLPLALADIGQLWANVVPVSLGALLAALAPLAAARLPGRRRAAGEPGPARTGLAWRTTVAIQRLAGRAQSAVTSLRSAWHSACQRARRSPRHALMQARRTDDTEIRWPVAGGLWLSIGGLLLTAFISGT